MPTPTVSKWYHSNHYSADVECEHCCGIVRHEEWCITRNRSVAYAYKVVLDSSQLTLEDELILHALGVAWTGKACDGRCKQ